METESGKRSRIRNLDLFEEKGRREGAIGVLKVSTNFFIIRRNREKGNLTLKFVLPKKKIGRE